VNAHSDDGDYSIYRNAGMTSVYRACTFLDATDIIINRVQMECCGVNFNQNLSKDRKGLPVCNVSPCVTRREE
jgi:hypothetical protein